MNNAPMLDNVLISDLKIKRFHDELDSDYYNRVIYTASACWVRNMVLDNSLSNILVDKEDIVNGVSKLHLSERLTNIIFGLISIIPCDYKRNKINDEDYLMFKSKELADSIIDQMKNCYEISELNERIVTTPVQRLRFKNKTLVLGGNEVKAKDNYILTGIGKWDDTNENDILYNKAWNIPSNHSEYIKLLTDNVMWKEIAIPEELVIYRYHDNGYGVSEPFWIKYNNRVDDGLYLGKTGEIDNYKLYLININGSDIQVALLNEWYYKSKEYMRLIYAAANKSGFCPRISVHIESDHVELTPNCILPNTEDRIIQLSSWETRDNNDSIIRIIPIEIWNDISEIYINLGISIKEI